MRVEFHDNSKELEVESRKYASDGRKENQFGAINITAIEENKFGARYEEQYKMDYVISEDELRSLSSDSEIESEKPSLVYREGDVKKPRFQWQVHMIFSSHKEFKWTVECYASMNKKAVKFVKNETGKVIAKCRVDHSIWWEKGLTRGAYTPLLHNRIISQHLEHALMPITSSEM
nr:Zinc knuckle family protein [Ipomoea batatas]